jgi:hypothetical protein
MATSGKQLPDAVGQTFIKELEVLREIARSHKPVEKCVDRFPTNYSAIQTQPGPARGALAAHPAAKPLATKPAAGGKKPVPAGAKKPLAKKSLPAKKLAAKKPAAKKQASKKPVAKKTVEGYDNYDEEEGFGCQTVPDVPSNADLSAAQGAGFGTKRRTFPNGELSTDIYVRPGVLMNDAMISHRGSAASFDGSVVGGPDWQKRSLELCKQVQSANLGEPASFGCIRNPTEVGSDYSWKGNYKMVCNRIGDTWGGWYPAMLGCPAYDPTAKFRSTT